MGQWDQLRDLNQSTLVHGRTDRLFFLCGGIALLAKGIKDIEESLTGMPKDQQLTPQSNGSSATPRPPTQQGRDCRRACRNRTFRDKSYCV